MMERHEIMTQVDEKIHVFPSKYGAERQAPSEWGAWRIAAAERHRCDAERRREAIPKAPYPEKTQVCRAPPTPQCAVASATEVVRRRAGTLVPHGAASCVLHTSRGHHPVW